MTKQRCRSYSQRPAALDPSPQLVLYSTATLRGTLNVSLLECEKPHSRSLGVYEGRQKTSFFTL
nr:hypothetical protein [Nostoc sp. EkiNYC01]